MFRRERDEPANPKLETTAELSIGKEINMIKPRDFNHLDLVIEAKNNRLKSEFFFIYDYDQFNNCSLLKPNFNIFAEEGSLNHNSARFVIHYLTKELKKRFKEIIQSSKTGKTSLYDVFKPSLGQFDDEDITRSNEFIRSMFPYEGCSYTGKKLESIIENANWVTLILGLRLVWSLLPGAIIPWKSYNRFKEVEQKSNYSNIQSFYQTMPLYLPSHSHSCVLFEFLEIFIALFADDYFVDMNTSIDLIFTAGQICFNRDEFTEKSSRNDDDLTNLQKFYYKRGEAFYHLFIAYLRSLSQEPNFEHKALLDSFKIIEYPPKPYKPITQKALTLTVPVDPELSTTNYFKLISNAANATSRIYSSNHTFTKFENKFLDKFEINPYKIIENFLSKSSKNYLLKFDKTLDFENFKINNDLSEMRKNLKEGTISDTKGLISTFINEFSRYGFESQRLIGNNSESFIADTINFNFNSNMESVDSLPVRVSKLEITEWFINAWKYETFLGYLQNTVVLKLTKTIGDCDWLIITSHEKVSSKNHYLTPPASSASESNAEKASELGGPLDNSTKAQKNKGGMDGSSTKEQIFDVNKPTQPYMSSPKQKKPPPSKKDLKRISFPTGPINIGVFEKELKGEGITEQKNAPPQRRPIGSNSISLKPTLPEAATTVKQLSTPIQQSFSKSPIIVPPVHKDKSAVDSMDPGQAQAIADVIDFNIPSDSSASSSIFRLKKPVVLSQLDSPRVASSSSKPKTYSTYSESSQPRDNEKANKLYNSLLSSASSLGSACPLKESSSTQKKAEALHPYQQLNMCSPHKSNYQANDSEAGEAHTSSNSGGNRKIVETKISSQVPTSIVINHVPVISKDEQNSSFTFTPKEKPNSGKFVRRLSIHNTSKVSLPTKASPISQAFPKLFKKNNVNDLSKVSTSESSNSLSFINDGSGNSSFKQDTITSDTPAPRQQYSYPFNASKPIVTKVRQIAVTPTIHIPRIPSTPQTLTESTLSEANRSLDSNYNTPKDVSDTHNSSASSANAILTEGNDSTDFTEDEIVKDERETISSISKWDIQLDGLLEEIKDSMDPDEAARAFKVEDRQEIMQTSPLRIS